MGSKTEVRDIIRDEVVAYLRANGPSSLTGLAHNLGGSFSATTITNVAREMCNVKDGPRIRLTGKYEATRNKIGGRIKSPIVELTDADGPA